MEISKEIYDWLLSNQIVFPSELADDSEEEKYTLDEVSSQKFENAIKIAKLLKILFTRTQKDKKLLKQLDNVLDQGDPTTKVENWKIVATLSATLGITLDPDTLQLIAYGDYGLLAEFLTSLKAADVHTSQSVKQVNTVSMGSLAIDLNTLNESKNLANSANSLELIVLSISQCYSMKPKQAAGHLTEGSKYLARLILKGVKGDFKMVVGWYQELYANSRRLSKLLVSETSDQCIQIFSCLKFGLYCKNADVSEWCCRLYNKLSQDLIETEHGKDIYSWFVGDDGGIDGLLYMISKHEHLQNYAVEYLFSISLGNLEKTLMTIILAKCKGQKTFLNLLSDVIGMITTTKALKTKALDETLLQSIAKRLSTETSADLECSYLRTKILVCIWLELMESIEEEGQNISNTILSMLRKMCKEKHLSTSIVAYSMLFKLFEAFSEGLKPFAPTIYKTITLLLVEDFSKVDIKDFILSNLIATFIKIPSIPIIIFFDPFIKQLSLQVEYTPNPADLYAFSYVVSHPKFSAKYSSTCLNFLSKIIYKNQLLSAPAAQILEVVIQKFLKGDDSLRGYILKFAKLLLTTYTDISCATSRSAVKKTKYKSPSQKKLPEPPQVDESSKAQLLLFISFSSYLNKMLVSEQDLSLKDYLLECKARLDKIECREIDEMIALYPMENKEPEPEEQNDEDREEQKSIESGGDQESLQLAVPENRIVTSSQDSKPSNMQVAIYTKKNNEKVKNDIEKARKRLEDKRSREEKKKEMQKIKEEKANKALQKEMDKRKQDLGIVPRIMDQFDQKLTDKEPKKEIHMIDLDSEEERDSKAVKLFVTRYHKALKFLFDKYAATSYTKRPENFNELEERATTINTADLLKLLKDGSIATINRDDIKSLIRLIKARSDSPGGKALTFDEFKEFYIQASIYYGEKSSITTKPLVYNLIHFMQLITNASKSRGENAIILENPEATSLGDPDVLKELNRQIAKNPNTELPKGYTKVEIKQMKYMHTLPIDIGVPESMHISSIIVDEILFGSMGVHTLESQAFVETEVKVLPKISKPDKSKMKPKFLDEKEKKPTPMTNVKSAEGMKREAVKKSRVPLSPNIKMLLAKAPTGDRKVYEECANVLEELLFAIENGMGDITKAQRFLDPKVKNSHLKGMQDAKETKQREELEKEKKRLERHKALKKMVEEKAKKEEEEKKANAKKEKEEGKKAREETKKKVEEIQKMLEEKKKVKEDKKKQKEEEEKKAALTDAQKNKQDLEKKQKEHQEFLNKQKKELKLKNEELAAKRKGKAKETDEDKLLKQKEESKKLYIQNKQREEELTKSKLAGKQKHEEFMNKPELKDLFTKYDTPLSLLFDFYTKLEDFHIDRKIAAENDSIQFRTYMKFCINFALVPFIASTEEAVTVFKELTKQPKKIPKKDSTKVYHQLNYEQFKESLVKMAALGKVPLNASKFTTKSNILSQKLVDMEGMTVEIVEKLIQYMKISETDNKYTLQSKLSKIKEDDSKMKKKPTKENMEEAAAEMVEEAKLESEQKEENDKDPQANPETTEEKLIAPDGKTEDWKIEKS